MRTTNTLAHSSSSVPVPSVRGQRLPARDSADEPPAEPDQGTISSADPVGDQPLLMRALDAFQAPIEALLAELAAHGPAGKRWDGAVQQHVVAALRQHRAELGAASTALQTLQHLRSGQTALRVGRVDLGDLLIGIIPRWQAQAPSHSFELALPGTVPEIAADARLVEQAVDLVLGHAVRVSPEGSPVRVTLQPRADDVMISVRHIGHGEPTNDLSRMVEPFFVPPGQPVEAMYGGLELPVAQAICVLHSGRLWAEPPTTGAGILLLLTLAHVPRTLAAQPLPAPVATEETDAQHDLFPPRSRPVVLVIERDSRLLRYLRANLDAQHFRTFAAAGLEEAQRLIAREEPDLLLLSGSLDGDAEPVEHRLRRVREWTDALTLILVDRHDPAECARALDLGAADYLGKPLAIEELVARMRRALRGRETARRPTSTTDATFISGGLEVDFEQRTVTVAGKPAALSKTEFKLLRTLVQNAGRVLTHEMLLERVWGPGYAHEVEFVWVYVRRLRRKIEPDPAHPRFIQTIPGVGYRLARD